MIWIYISFSYLFYAGTLLACREKLKTESKLFKSVVLVFTILAPVTLPFVLGFGFGEEEKKQQ